MADQSLPNTAICPDCEAPYNSKSHHRECEGATPEECELIDAMKWRESPLLDGLVLCESDDCKSVN